MLIVPPTFLRKALWGSLALAGTACAPQHQAAPPFPPQPQTRVATVQEPSIRLTDEQAKAIGLRLWQNECAGTLEGLTSWNAGEHFASLGIGHFIWYPEGQTGPFEESFPRLLDYLHQRGVQVPRWLLEARGCPWPNRQAFLRDKNSPQMRELREFLASTVPEQARFAALRLENALPQMLAAAPAQERERIRRNFYRVAAEPLGPYALVDYVNFKGEGISPTERYQGQGWGLLQVLQEMGEGPAMHEFSTAAYRVLERRVRLSPPERNEARWLPGWRNRTLTYAR